MGKQIYNMVYNGLDKEERIDCLAQIRRMQNPPGSTCLDDEGLCKSNRNTRNDAQIDKKDRVPGQFVRIGKIEF